MYTVWGVLLEDARTRVHVHVTIPVVMGLQAEITTRHNYLSASPSFSLSSSLLPGLGSKLEVAACSTATPLR